MGSSPVVGRARLAPVLAAVAGLAAAVLAPGGGHANPPAGTALAARPVVVQAGPAGVAVSNASLAQVFTMLTHDMEWGGTRRHLVRFEGPVSVGLDGPGAEAHAGFLDGYLDRLRRRSGIDIARRPGRANLHVRFVGRGFERAAPGILCFVVAGDVDWARFAADPRGHDGRRLAAAGAIGDMTVFIPADAPPQRARSCLVEEVAQALGPANDLYGLGDTIFNDDDAHFWPTALDHLMLRVLYSDGLATGMDRAATERAARAVLDRINPAGVAAPPIALPQPRRMADWRARVQGAFEGGIAPAVALRRALEAVAIAEARAPGSAYHCHALVTLGQVQERSDRRSGGERALATLDAAEAVCRHAHGAGDVRLAWIGLMRAETLLDQRRHGEAAEQAGRVLPAFVAAGQEAPAAAARDAQVAALAALGRHGGARAAGGTPPTLLARAVSALHGSLFARQR